MKRLMMLAKSTWLPAIRREHALAALAYANGVLVDFIEAPSDIRALRGVGRRGWFARLGPPAAGRSHPGVAAYRRSTIVPGHRGRLAATVDNRLLRRSVQALCPPDPAGTAVVVNVPWQWDATAGIPARRVFDAADDWNLLLAGRRPHLREMYARIADEADAIVVANPNLAELFPGRHVRVVPNGTQADLAGEPAVPAREPNRLVYVGTFSERFDADLVTRVLTLLPGHTLDLYGECRYAGHGAKPAAEFLTLLARFRNRVTWHGVLHRPELAGVLNAAGAGLVPHRAEFSRGQSSMKFLDYAARGCPVVSTRWERDIDRQAPPGVWFADTAEDYAAAVRRAAAVDPATVQAAMRWARRQTWEHRWPLWSDAVFGSAA